MYSWAFSGLAGHIVDERPSLAVDSESEAAMSNRPRITRDGPDMVEVDLSCPTCNERNGRMHRDEWEGLDELEPRFEVWELLIECRPCWEG
jgi:hypothetical protein